MIREPSVAADTDMLQHACMHAQHGISGCNDAALVPSNADVMLYTCITHGVHHN